MVRPEDGDMFEDDDGQEYRSLTVEQTYLLTLLADGSSLLQAAEHLGWPIGRARIIRDAALTRLGVRTSIEAVVVARRYGWISPESRGIYDV